MWRILSIVLGMWFIVFGILGVFHPDFIDDLKIADSPVGTSLVNLAVAIIGAIVLVAAITYRKFTARGKITSCLELWNPSADRVADRVADREIAVFLGGNRKKMFILREDLLTAWKDCGLQMGMLVEFTWEEPFILSGLIPGKLVSKLVPLGPIDYEI